MLDLPHVVFALAASAAAIAGPVRHSYSDYIASAAHRHTQSHQHGQSSVQHDFSDSDSDSPLKPPPPPPFFPYDPATMYNGIKTFAHAPPVRCLTLDNSTLFDFAVLGAPFDSLVSWRPGARFGPGGIRNGAQRLGGANRIVGNHVFVDYKVVDCGDSRMSYYETDVALGTLEEDYRTLLAREVATPQTDTTPLALDGKEHPRVVMLGGDHTIVLPALRALSEVYGPVAVVHFDSHCDSRHPNAYSGKLMHGDYFYFAWKEGLMQDRNIHAGIRSNCDMPTDLNANFTTILADDIEDIGWKGVIRRIKQRVGNAPVYLTLDIDVVDPAFAPATGTPEIGKSSALNASYWLQSLLTRTGGWTTREMLRIIRGLKDLNIVGADIVEVSPAYDNQAEITQVTAAGLAFEMLSIMGMTPLRR